VTREVNAPTELIAECNTKRWTVADLDVRRMFDAAEVAEVVQEATAALAEAQTEMLRDVARRLAISFC
jgi:hypothetical protein